MSTHLKIPESSAPQTASTSAWAPAVPDSSSGDKSPAGRSHWSSTPLGDGFGFLLGPAWRRDCGIGPGDTVDVLIAPEGTQRTDLAPDAAAALEAEPEAGVFFDSLAQFYRRAYLRWIDGTRRRPEVRAERIAELVKLLKAGKKERPSGPETPRLNRHVSQRDPHS